MTKNIEQAREAARAGDGKFGTQPAEEATGVTLTEPVRVPPAELEAVRAYIDEVDPDDWGSDHAIDYELSQKHVLLHHLEAGTAIGDLAVTEDTYMVSTRDPHGDVTEAFFVKEPAVNDLFNAAIDKCDAEYMKSVGG